MNFKFFGKRKQARKEQKEFNNKIEALLEELGIDEEDMNEPPPISTMEELTTLGLTRAAARTYNYIQTYMVDGSFTEDLGVWSEFNSDNKDAIFQRMVLLPEFFQAVSEVLSAITNKKIKPNLEDVKKTFPLIVRRLFQENVSKFWAATNELRNISTGMAKF